MTLPYLFVGAGVSIRYASAESWSSLLRRYCEPAGRPYEYYASTADGDLPQLATLLADDFHEHWWADEAFADSRAANSQLIVARDSALKVEISAHLASTTERLPTTGPLADELALLRTAEVDGIITTNFDPILEFVRPDLHPFVGQDELVFADPQGVGEIYKIHGSCTQPNSLVLTADDYARFQQRNAYLVAKLLTIFVEHPVIFLGYSLTDRNVQQILVDIARCLTDDRIESLRDRLLFVQYQADVEPSMTSTVISAEGFAIPVQSIIVPDYQEVLTVLNGLQRRIPARLLRHLRKQIYDLVTTSEPTGSLFVEELSDETEISDVEVYAGIGAVARLTTSYVGLDRHDLIADVLEDRGYDAARVILEALPPMGSRRTQVPIYKYLRGAGLLEPDGSLRNAESIDLRVSDRVNARNELMKGMSSYERRAERVLNGVQSLEELIEQRTAGEVLYFLPFMPEDRIDPGALRTFLLSNREVYDEDRQPLASQWIKAVCRYDWLVHGRAD